MSKHIDLRTQAQHLLLAIDETEQGNAALEQRDFERAMVHFQQVLTLEPENAEARRLFEKAERGKATQVREAAMKKAALRAMLTVMGIGLFGFLLYMTVISWGPAAYHQVMSVYGPSPTFTATATHTLTPTPTATFTYTSTPTKTYTPTPTYTYTPTFTPTSTVTQTPTPTPVIVILTGNVWMFAEPDPDENTPRVGSLVRNTLVQVLAVQGDWVKVKSINYEGWVTRQYVGFTSSPPSDMVTPAPPTRTPRPRTPTPTVTKAP